MTYNDFDKAKYNREYARKRYEQFREDKAAVAQALGNECFLCGETDGSEYFHLHHVEYGPESDYPRNSKAQWTRILRVQEAGDHPERFRLLCQPCHRLVTHFGNRMLKLHQRNPRISLAHLFWLIETETFNRME